jgi:hypothetical protein
MIVLVNLLQKDIITLFKNYILTNSSCLEL